MRSIVSVCVAAILLLAACQSGIAPDRTGRGGPAQLYYAPDKPLTVCLFILFANT